MDFNYLTKATLFRSQNISRHAGVAWTLLDQNEQVLICDGVIAGFHPKRLAFSISRNKEAADHLFVSLEPVGGVFDIDALISRIETSSLLKCTFYSRVPCNLRSKAWVEWSRHWRGTVAYLNEEPKISDTINTISKVASTLQPWVTSISAADIGGRTLPAGLYKHEFGMTHFIATMVKEARAVIYAKSMKELVKELPRENNMEEEIEYYEIDQNAVVEPLLRYCKRENIYNAIALCDMETLAYLAHHRLVDEMVHHVTAAAALSTQKCAEVQLLRLRGWHIAACSVTGNASRILLKKTTAALNGRFN